MAPTRLLIVDDDPKLQAYMSRGLEESGMSCVTASSAEEASALLLHDDASAEFDLILL
ncbi:MAG: DNA-binding response OmpR family regulator, partial [Gammaproteobacteria bacterium]